MEEDDPWRQKGDHNKNQQNERANPQEQKGRQDEGKKVGYQQRNTNQINAQGRSTKNKDVPPKKIRGQVNPEEDLRRDIQQMRLEEQEQYNQNSDAVTSNFKARSNQLGKEKILENNQHTQNQMTLQQEELIFHEKMHITREKEQESHHFDKASSNELTNVLGNQPKEMLQNVEMLEMPTTYEHEQVEEIESLHNFLDTHVKNQQVSYTNLLMEQIRLSQENKEETVQMDASMKEKKGTKFMDQASFMDLLTSKYGFKQIRLPYTTPSERKDDEVDYMSGEDMITIESLPSDDEIVTIECIEAHVGVSEAFKNRLKERNEQDVEARKTQGTPINEGYEVEPEEIEFEKGNVNTNEQLNGEMMQALFNEENEVPYNMDYADNYENQENPLLEEKDQDVSLSEESNWRADIFLDMRVEQVDQQVIENANSNTEKNDNENAEKADEDTDASEIFTEEDIEAFLCKEKLAASEGNNADLDSMYTPQMDQKFKTRDDAHRFFTFYAFLAGFEVVITHTTRTISKKREGEIYKVEMRCHKNGKAGEPIKKPKKPKKQKGTQGQEAAETEDERDTNVQVRTNCQVVMSVKLENDFWTVVRLDLDHNHELYPENRNQLCSGRKYMTNMEKSMIRTLNDNNIPTRKMIAILSYLRGSVLALPYKNKDVANYRTKINREVTASDITKTVEYLRQRKEEDPTFYYKFDVDKKMKVRNIFWREGTSLQYYAEYGDCVSFDSTYMTNKYNLPFCPFVGVTGHGHTCMFGCAFLQDETTDTFIWLFETFLESMGGKHPKTIITDQDKAMKAAIEHVFKYTVHRNCFFHIKYKCYNKNGKCFKAKDGSADEFEDIVNNCLTTEEFEHLWQKMIADNHWENNKYFSKMWENRARFIPVYFKENFFPFLQSTGRSEGTNARLKENVGPTYSMISFLKEFQRIVDGTNIKEEFAHNQSRQKRPKELKLGYNVEKQAMELYNRNIFKRFQQELIKTETLKYKEIEKGKIFEVWPKTNQIYKVHRMRKYIVLTDLTEGQEEFSCICAKFSKDGILCSHILKVIVEEEINKIPDKYIIDRWRKKDCKMQLQKPEIQPKTHEMLRFNVLSRKTAVINSKGAMTEEATKYLTEELDRINIELEKLLSRTLAQPVTSGAGEGPSNRNTESSSTNELELGELQDPDRVKNKGRPRVPKRLKPIREEIREKAKSAEKKKRKKQQSTPNTPSPKGSEKKIQRKRNQDTSARQDI